MFDEFVIGPTASRLRSAARPLLVTLRPRVGLYFHVFVAIASFSPAVNMRRHLSPKMDRGARARERARRRARWRVSHARYRWVVVLERKGQVRLELRTPRWRSAWRQYVTWSILLASGEMLENGWEAAGSLTVNWRLRFEQ